MTKLFALFVWKEYRKQSITILSIVTWLILIIPVSYFLFTDSETPVPKFEQFFVSSLVTAITAVLITLGVIVCKLITYTSEPTPTLKENYEKFKRRWRRFKKAKHENN